MGRILERASFQKQLLQNACRDACGAVGTLDQADIALRNLNGELHFQNFSVFNRAFRKGFRQKTDAQILLDQRENLVGGRDFQIGREHHAVIGKETAVELIGSGIVRCTDQWIFLQVRQMQSVPA